MTQARRSTGTKARTGSGAVRPKARVVSSATRPKTKPGAGARGATPQKARPAPRAAAAQRVRLELLKLEITRKANKGWDLYLLLATEDPKQPNKTVLSVAPEGETIDFSRRMDNMVRFRPKGQDTEGLTVFEAAIPADRHLKVRAWIFQSKRKARRSGEILGEITEFLDKNVAKTLRVAAPTNPYVQAAILVNKSLGMIGGLVEQTKDKNRGFVNMDEEFDADGPENIRRVHQVGGDFELTYRWCLRD